MAEKSDSGSEDDLSGRRARPQRSCRKGKVASMAEPSDSGSDESDEPPRSGRRSRPQAEVDDSGDDEYVDDASDDEDEYAEATDDGGDSDARSDEPPRSGRRARPPRSCRKGKATSMAEPSDSGSDESDEPPRSGRRARPQRACRHHARRTTAENDDDDGDDGDDGEEGEEEGEEAAALRRQLEEDNEDEEWVKDNLDAAVDEITTEPLMPKHVVWRSPDGSKTMRFNLSTLRKVAQRAGAWRAPPHFRSGLDEPLRAQIVRKFGKRALQPVWHEAASGAASFSAASAMEDAGTSSEFFQRLAEWERKKLSDVHNLYLCPICMHWLGGEAEAEGGEETEEGEEGEEGGEGGADGVGARGGASGAARSVCEIDVECQPCDPISTLYGAPAIAEWHSTNSLPPECAAAQCCFRTQAHLTAHLRNAHRVKPAAIRDIKDRLNSFQVRGGDGYVHRYLSAQQRQIRRRSSPSSSACLSEGHTRQYWAGHAEEVASLADASEATWFSRAALYLALYDEVEAQTRGEGPAGADADAALFGARLASRVELPARPAGAASESVARAAAEEAWRVLGYGDGDDAELDRNFLADDDEEGSGDEEGGHMAMHLREQLGGLASETGSVSGTGGEGSEGSGEEGWESGEERGSDDDDESDMDDVYGEYEGAGALPGERIGWSDDDTSESPIVFDDERDELDAAEAKIRRQARRRRDRIEYDDAPDALDLAEAELRRKKRRERSGGERSGGGRAAAGGSEAGGAGGAGRSIRRRPAAPVAPPPAAPVGAEDQDGAGGGGSRGGGSERKRPRRIAIAASDSDDSDQE